VSGTRGARVEIPVATRSMLNPPRRCVNEVSAEASQWKDLVLVSRRCLIAVVFDAPGYPESRIPGELRGTRRPVGYELR